MAPNVGINITTDHRKRKDIVTIHGLGEPQPTEHDPEKLLDIISSLEEDSGMLPPAVRWVSQSSRMAILERPPHMATIRYYGAEVKDISKCKSEQTFTVPVPWTVYAVQLDLERHIRVVNLYTRSTSITSEDDELYLLPLTNLYDDGKFCLRQDTDSAPNLGAALNRAHNEVWDSNFNMDVIAAAERAWNYRQPYEMFEHIPNDVPFSAASLLAIWEKKFKLEDVLEWQAWAPVNWQHAPGGHVDPESPFSVSHLIDHLERLDQEFFGSPTYFINTMRQKLQSTA